MPTRLIHPNPSIQQAARALSRTNTPRATVRAEPPYSGYAPDLDPTPLDAGICWGMANLVPGVVPGLGEVLKVPPGFDEVDTARLPLGADANTNYSILLLGWFPRTDVNGDYTNDWDLTAMAVSAGDEANRGSCEPWRLQPTTGQWEEIQPSGAANTVALYSDYPDNSGDRHLFDWAVMPNGATPRTGLSLGSPGAAPNTALEEPAFVFTNLLDPVMVYPVDPGAGTTEDGDYENLTLAFGNGAAGFRARSVEAWNDRLNFLNTIENGIHYRQRLRRTAKGNADPDTVNDGSGSMDFRDFSEDGLRCETLGNLLACYFGDGVAVVQATGNPTAPYDPQVITTKRGLLSTFSVANLGGGAHFGIFTDGFYFFEEGGSFTEAGVAEINGRPTYKWKQTFFERLDMDLRERIFLYYDHINKWIWMTLPLDGAENNQECWIYDPFNDRVFPAPIPATVFGTINQQLQVAYIIDGATPDLTDISIDGTIGGIPGTIGALAARFGVKAIIHGTHNGLVMMHNPALTTQINIDDRNAYEAEYRYRSVLATGGTPRTLKTGERLFMEHVKTANGGDPTFMVFGNDGTEEQYVVSLTPGNPGDVVTVSHHFCLSSQQMGFEINGTGPVNIRSMELDVLDYGVEPGE